MLVGAERHDTVDLALRYLGLGAPEPVAADDQGRIDPGALASALGELPPGTPAIVVLQAGNVHSGAFDPFARRSRSRTAPAPGCTSTARSACSPPRRR